MVFNRGVRRILGGHLSGIKGEVPALKPSELLLKTLPKIRLTQTVMHSQASSSVDKQNTERSRSTIVFRSDHPVYSGSK